MFENSDPNSAVAATILLASELEELLATAASDKRDQAIQKILATLATLTPQLHAIALFDLFTPLDWLHSLPRLREGRAMVAVLYLQQYRHLVTHEVRSRLDQLKKIVSPILKGQIEKLLS